MRFQLLLLFLAYPLIANCQQEELPVPGQNLFVNKINVVQSLNSGFDGQGITVSIKEFGFDTADVDLKNRVLPNVQASSNLTTHANIMACLVGGAGNSDLQGRGVAPGCRLVSSSFVGLQPDPDYGLQNITVQNHAYGVGIQNWYGPGAVAYDQTSMDYPNLLHVFSAGNKLDSASISGTYANIPGYANLSGNFKMAKNILVVGAVDSTLNVDPFSSKGPAYDGRTKPDLVAFGLEGTSGAAALVSGAAAVIQQALTFSLHEMPSSALVRAILVNSADDLDAPGPDFASGYGNLNLKKALECTFDQQYFLQQIEMGQTLSFPLNLPDQLHQLKITLSWNDPEAALLAPKALLHDLNFSLIDPNGQKHFPWVLNTFPNLDSLRLPARKGRDTLNNLEQITVELPTGGLWEIRVQAAANLIGSQDFALAWDWDTLQHFEWTYPYLNDPAPAGTAVILRWETNFPDTFGQLEWRPWPSSSWELIKAHVPLQRGWERWTLPDTFAESQVRMRIGTQAINSAIFLISKPLRMEIGFNCTDSIYLYWNSAHPSAQYQLYGLGEQYLEPLSIVTDTFVVLQKADFPQSRFAVAPLAPEKDALGPRSTAPDISTQGVECYFSNFFAELNPDIQVDLRLDLGTNYQAYQIVFEKQIEGRFVALDAQLADRLSFSFVDQTLQNGANIYRPRLILANGAAIVGDTVTVYYGSNQGWWVFPNPVTTQGFINVVSATDGEAIFTLFDGFGKQLLEKPLTDVNTSIPVYWLAQGLYYFKIRQGDRFLGEGKIIKLGH